MAEEHNNQMYGGGISAGERLPSDMLGGGFLFGLVIGGVVGLFGCLVIMIGMAEIMLPILKLLDVPEAKSGSVMWGAYLFYCAINFFLWSYLARIHFISGFLLALPFVSLMAISAMVTNNKP